MLHWQRLSRERARRGGPQQQVEAGTGLRKWSASQAGQMPNKMQVSHSFLYGSTCCRAHLGKMPQHLLVGVQTSAQRVLHAWRQPRLRRSRCSPHAAPRVFQPGADQRPTRLVAASEQRVDGCVRERLRVGRREGERGEGERLAAEAVRLDERKGRFQQLSSTCPQKRALSKSAH
jgi:hypothetical protein